MNLYDFYKAKLEYGTEAIATDPQLATHLQEILIWFGLLDPPADGKFGQIAANALREFQEIMSPKIPELADEIGFLGQTTTQALLKTPLAEVPKPDLDLGSDFASIIIKYMQQKSYKINSKPGEYIIIYVTKIDSNGKLNNNQPNGFNDLRLVIEFQEAIPKIVGSWEATTKPGYSNSSNSLNSKDATQIAYGQYKAWQVGFRGQTEPHEMLIQVKNVRVHRDINQDVEPTGDETEIGLFGINQQWGYDLPRNNIAYASTGCLVGRTREGHQAFMEIIKQDKRYQQNHDYLFLTTVISGNDLDKQFPVLLETEKINHLKLEPLIIEVSELQNKETNLSRLEKLNETVRLIQQNLSLDVETNQNLSEEISQMNPEQQLEFVKRYLKVLLVYCSNENL